MILCVCVALIVGWLLAASGKSFGSGLTEYLGADAVTKLAVVVGGARTHSVPVTIVDIDEASLLAWGSPPSVPREKLARLVRSVLDGRPRAVVVDVDMSLDHGPELAAISALIADPSAVDTPPLFLVRHLRRLPRGNDVADAVLDRKTPLDTTVRAAPNARWVAALLDGDNDWYFREWTAFRAVCADGPARAYPSVALATTAVAADGKRGLAVMDDWLRRAASATCALPAPGPVERKRDDPDWLANADRTMTMPFAVGHTADVARFGTTDLDGRTVPLFGRLQADQLLVASEPPDIAGRIAIIGATYADSGDHHRTPLGAMPGVYMLANMVALGGGPLSEGRWWGLKAFALGTVFFALHLAATILLSGALAPVVILATTWTVTAVAVLARIPPHLVYEAAVIGVALIAVHVFVSTALDRVRRGSRHPGGAGRLARLAFSDPTLRWLASRRSRR